MPFCIRAAGSVMAATPAHAAVCAAGAAGRGAGATPGVVTKTSMKAVAGGLAAAGTAGAAAARTAGAAAGTAPAALTCIALAGVEAAAEIGAGAGAGTQAAAAEMAAGPGGCLVSTVQVLTGGWPLLMAAATGTAMSGTGEASHSSSSRSSRGCTCPGSSQMVAGRGSDRGIRVAMPVGGSRQCC